MGDASATLPALDLEKPYLLGFEYARAGDAGTILEEDHQLQNNLYRHPDRWGRPTIRFEKSHDIYALMSELLNGQVAPHTLWLGAFAAGDVTLDMICQTLICLFLHRESFYSK
jgi:hypothetical protein